MCSFIVFRFDSHAASYEEEIGQTEQEEAEQELSRRGVGRVGKKGTFYLNIVRRNEAAKTWFFEEGLNNVECPPFSRRRHRN